MWGVGSAQGHFFCQLNAKTWISINPKNLWVRLGMPLPFYGLNRINLLCKAKRSVVSQLPRRAVPWSPSEDDCSTTVAGSPRLIVIGSILRLNGLQTFPDNQIKALKPWTNTMKRHFSASFPDFFHKEIQFVTVPSGEAQFSLKDSHLTHLRS